MFPSFFFQCFSLVFHVPSLWAQTALRRLLRLQLLVAPTPQRPCHDSSVGVGWFRGSIPSWKLEGDRPAKAKLWSDGKSALWDIGYLTNVGKTWYIMSHDWECLIQAIYGDGGSWGMVYDFLPTLFVLRILEPYHSYLFILYILFGLSLGYYITTLMFATQCHKPTIRGLSTVLYHPSTWLWLWDGHHALEILRLVFFQPGCPTQTRPSNGLHGLPHVLKSPS